VRTASCHLCAHRFKGQGRFKGQVCEISTHHSFNLTSPRCSRCLLCPFHFGFNFVFLGCRCNVVASQHPPDIPPTPRVASQPSRAPASLISTSAAAVQGELAPNTFLRIISSSRFGAAPDDPSEDNQLLNWPYKLPLPPQRLT
jgi:hypothetical protein